MGDPVELGNVARQPGQTQQKIPILFSMLHCKAEQPESLVVVLPNTQAEIIKHPQAVLSIGVTLPGRHRVPPGSLAIILRNAPALIIRTAQFILRPRIALARDIDQLGRDCGGSIKRSGPHPGTACPNRQRKAHEAQR